MKKGEKIYNDGMSPALRYYHRNKEKILAKMAAEREINPAKYAAQRAARKDKENAQKRVYRVENKDKIANYFVANRDRFLASRKEKYALDRDRICAERREKYAANPEPTRESVKAWADANPEKIRAQRKAYAAANPEAIRLISSTKRARKRSAKGEVSRDIIDKLMALQRGKCPVCRCDLVNGTFHLDHIEPLARGGAHDDKNLQLLCKPCNLSKHAKPPIEFMQSRGFLL